MSCCSSSLTFNQHRILRGDPTRTLGISRRWIADWNRRARKLQKSIRKWLVTDDELALNVRTYQFATDDVKLAAFNTWVTQQIEADVFAVDPRDALRPWNAQYIESSYRRGMMNAYLSSREAQLLESLGVGEQTAEEFLRTGFAQPETMQKVRLLYTRSFEQMRGVTAEMKTQMNTILAQGIAEGRNPREIARQMNERIAGISRRRAHTIARTEVINAHAEGQLDSFERMGVKQLGIKAEWVTAGDDRVCPDCFEREGQIFSVDEARGLIPLHPNCRCTWVPHVPTE